MENQKRRHTDHDTRGAGDQVIITVACIVVVVFALMGVASAFIPNHTCHHALEEPLDK